MIDTKAFTEAGTAAVDTAAGLAGKTLEGVEKLSALNLQLGKTLLSEAAAQAQALFDAKGPEELVALQAAAVQAAPAKATAYARQVQEIVGAVIDAYGAVADTQVAQAEARLLETLDGALKNVPGNEQAAALAKSVLAATKSAVDGVNQASKQVVAALATEPAEQQPA